MLFETQYSCWQDYLVGGIRAGARMLDIIAWASAWVGCGRYFCRLQRWAES